MVFRSRAPVAIAIACAIAAASSFAPAGTDALAMSHRATAAHRRYVPHASPSLPSRRAFLASAAITSSARLVCGGVAPAGAASPRESLVRDLDDSLARIETIPSLLESSEWDGVRTVLKTPPVNQLWNLGESQNTLTRLAKETGEFGLVEIKDELAISLQMTDQYSYDNVFVYFQPGNGKVKVKEPMEMANKAISQLREAIDLAKSS